MTYGYAEDDSEDGVESQKCHNCGTFRESKDYIVEKCPNCGDEEYDYLEESSRHFPV